MMNPFSNAKDSIRGSAASLLGKERTWKDEVGDMCPSLTYTQARPQSDRSAFAFSPARLSFVFVQRLPLTPTWIRYLATAVLGLWDLLRAGLPHQFGGGSLPFCLSPPSRPGAWRMAYVLAERVTTLCVCATVAGTLRILADRRSGSFRNLLLPRQRDLTRRVSTPAVFSAPFRTLIPCMAGLWRRMDRRRTSFIIGERPRTITSSTARRWPRLWLVACMLRHLCSLLNQARAVKSRKCSKRTAGSRLSFTSHPSLPHFS